MNYLRPSAFGLRVGLKPSRVRELLRLGVIPGAERLPSGRWRIPEASVERYQQGERSLDPTVAATPLETSRLFFRLYGQGRVPAWHRNG